MNVHRKQYLVGGKAEGGRWVTVDRSARVFVFVE